MTASADDPVDWGLYRTFLAVMACGSLTAAGKQLGLTQPSVGRQIEALERALGLSLFTRSGSGLQATPAAHELQAAVSAMATAARHAARAAAGARDEQACTIRLSVSQIMGGEVMPQILARYARLHPLTRIELVLNNAQDDLLQREADVAVRMLRPSQQALIARHLGRVEIGLYAHRSYVADYGMPASVLELGQHRLIGPDRDPSIAALLAQHQITLERDWFALRTDNDLAQMAALRAGLGISGCHLGIGRRDPDLLPVLHDVLRFELQVWLVTHEDLRADRRVMSLFEFLAQELQSYALSSCAATDAVTQPRGSNL